MGLQIAIEKSKTRKIAVFLEAHYAQNVQAVFWPLEMINHFYNQSVKLKKEQGALVDRGISYAMLSNKFLTNT